MTRRYLILMGAPGAGKGTQAARLAQEWELCRISTGDLLRAAVAAGTSLGQRAEAIMASGDLVSDGLILELVEEELDRESCSRGAVFDGFPRTLEQAIGLGDLLERRGCAVEQVIVIEVPDSEIVRRLSERRVCESCEKLYHLSFDPPGDDGRCTACGGGLRRRPDDEPDTVLRRLEVYREQTQPVIDYYANERGASQTGVATVDGSRSIDEVASDIRERLAVVEAER